MKSLILLLGSFVMICGCAQKPAEPATTAEAPKAAAPSGAGDIRPIGPNIGPMTPVAGGEDLGSGTGGGLGQRAKDMAKGAAAQSSQPQPSAGDDTGQ